MRGPSREQVYLALLALLTPLGPTGSGLFKTVTRECKERERWNEGDQPVLMQYELDEDIVNSAAPAAFQQWECWLLIGCKTNPGTAGAAVLNPLIDAVLDAIAPSPGPRKFQTLGTDPPLVRSVLPMKVIKDVGDNSTAGQNRQAGASIQLQLIVPFG